MRSSEYDGTAHASGSSEYGPHGGGAHAPADLGYPCPQNEKGGSDATRAAEPAPPAYTCKSRIPLYNSHMAQKRAVEPFWMKGTRHLVERRLMLGSREAGQCRLWVKGEDGSEYGMMWVQGPKHGKNVRVHHIAWWISFGLIPAGRYVKRSCGNRRCIARGHLVLAERRQPKESKFLPRLRMWTKPPAQRSASPESGPAGSVSSALGASPRATSLGKAIPDLSQQIHDDAGCGANS